MIITLSIQQTPTFKALLYKGKKKHLPFTNKTHLWEYIKSLAYSEAKQRHTLTIYMINHQQQFYTYVPYTDKHLSYLSQSPFIVEYKLTKQERAIYKLPPFKSNTTTLINFYDISNLYPIIKPASTLKHNYYELSKLLQQQQAYNQKNECTLIHNAIQLLKTTLKQEHIHLKRYITISQIAIQYMNKKLQEQAPHQYLPHSNTLIPSKHHKLIHQSYRGGRAELFQPNIQHEQTTNIDRSNAYGHALANIPMPDLNSERHIQNPLQYYKQEDLLHYEGLSECLIKNNNDQLGILPVTTKGNSAYYPRSGDYILGTYTHLDLRQALQQGYTILHISQSLIYTRTIQNPFTEIINNLYKKRQETNSTYLKWFYKQIINRSIGKFGQYRATQTLKIDDIDKAPTYLAQGYTIKKGIKNKYLYQKTEHNKKTKNYYCPIISSYVTAYCRQLMHHYYKKIPQQDLIYTDTDSIIYKGKHDHHFPLSNKLGDFHIEWEHQPFHGTCPKVYTTNTHTRSAGATKQYNNPKTYTQGTLRRDTLNTINTVTDEKTIGTRETTTLQLKTMSKNYQDRQYRLQERKLYIDKHLEDITPFKKIIIHTFSNTITR